jgi:protein-tyrosine phosphatase
MPPDIFWIKAAGRGRLAVMPRPRGGDWLEDEILHLKRSGVGTLVSMLTLEEESLLELGDEADLARRHGLDFVSHPIPDRDVPRSAGEMWALARSLAEQFRTGRQIAVHCRMGIGRSPLLLACILVSTGLEPDEAWEAIGEARGCVVPDTAEQRAWLDRTAPGR